jgi:hypothetical protein
MNTMLIGIVEQGRFNLLSPEPGTPGGARLTSISMQAAQPPESGELDLAQYEGGAIAVQGHDGGGWIYEASVVDTGGPILAALVREVFGTEVGLG